MADSFIRLTLKDGSTHTVIADGDPAAIVNAAAQGQRWGDARRWSEVEGGRAGAGPARRERGGGGRRGGAPASGATEGLKMRALQKIGSGPRRRPLPHVSRP